MPWGKAVHPLAKTNTERLPVIVRWHARRPARGAPAPLWQLHARPAHGHRRHPGPGQRHGQGRPDRRHPVQRGVLSGQPPLRQSDGGSVDHRPHGDRPGRPGPAEAQEDMSRPGERDGDRTQLPARVPDLRRGREEPDGHGPRRHRLVGDEPPVPERGADRGARRADADDRDQHSEHDHPLVVR